MPEHTLFFDFGRGLFPRKPVLIPLIKFLAERNLPPKRRYHDCKRHSNLKPMRPRKRRKLAKQGVSDIEKIEILRRMFGRRVPISQYYLVGEVHDLSREDLQTIEQEFFDGEQQPKVHLELITIGHKQRLLRIKHAKTLRLCVTIAGKDYPLVRAEDSNEFSACFPLYLPTQ